MSQRERLQNERDFHDRQARARARDLRPRDLPFADDSYLGHACWIRPAFERLGELRGLRVLDLGCGHGMASVVLARRGARVTACDLSVGYLREARARASANGTVAQWAVADGERLPFADGVFDRIWGSAILHHLDLRRAAPELYRVLRPGGVAVFCEPWGENRWLRWARRNVPYPGKQRTADEDPLLRRHLRPLRAFFPRLELTGHQLFAMASRIVRNGPVVKMLQRWDALLLCRWPQLQRYCRYVVLTLRKEWVESRGASLHHEIRHHYPRRLR
jgi:SAM-dependent methyltransferase